MRTRKIWTILIIRWYSNNRYIVLSHRLITDTGTCISPASEPFCSEADCTCTELLFGGQIWAMWGRTLLTATLSWLLAGTNVDCGDDDTTLPWLRDRSLELDFLLDAGRSLATSLACMPVTLRNSWSSASYCIWIHQTQLESSQNIHYHIMYTPTKQHNK